MPLRSLVALLALTAAGAADASAAVDLRGYGRVATTFAAGSATFVCADDGHADTLFGKLLADLFWDARGATVERTLDVGGRALPVRSWAPYGLIAIGRVGARVVAVGGDDEAALRARLAGSPLIDAGASFAPARPYPRSLDFTDLRAAKSYVHAMMSPHGEGLASHWPAAQRLGLGGLAFQDLSFVMQSPARGVVDFTSADYEVRDAEAHDGMSVIGLSCGGSIPLWAYDRHPESAMRAAPTALIGAWGGAAAAGARFESWWAPLADRLDGGLGFLAQTVRRYDASPALGGWHLYTGSPGAEFGMHGTGQVWDHSPIGAAGLRTWLRARGLDPAALGERWYGDARRFASWDDVTVPDVNGFFGALDATCLRPDGWRWLKSDAEAPPSADDPAWLPVAMPPSQQQDFLPWGAAFYRVAFDAAQWRAAHPGEAWLVCGVDLRSDRPTRAWLNGELVLAKPTPDALALSVAIGAKLRDHGNELVIHVPQNPLPPGNAGSDGKIYGPVFITATEPKRYPDLGPHANARWADLQDWLVASNMQAHRTMLEAARALDPDRPIVLSGDANEFSDHVSALAADFGCIVQHTGREAWYHPWWAGIGLLTGAYGGGEESGTTAAPMLERELGWILIDGDANHDLFWDLEDYQKLDRETGWMSAHRRLYELVGKARREMPAVCVLRSARAMRFGCATPWNWDIGRGDLQAAHYDNAYATERELLAGLVDRCPVLFDSGTEFLDDDALRALHGYCARGGTFIALHRTGLHTAAEPGSLPIARLTGFAPVERQGASIAIADDAPALRAWRGRRFFAGAGAALAPRDDRLLDGETPEVIARWEDGRVAVAQRRIGKGRVIVLGATFWREGRDPTGALASAQAIQDAFFTTLFAELGIARTADASNRAIWARSMIAKNGLQRWLVARNDSEGDQAADLRLRLAERPATVVDLVSGESVPFAWDDGMAVVAAQRFAPYQARVYAARRASLVDALPAWWEEKTIYARRDRAREAAPIPPPTHVDGDPIACERWRVAADGDVAARDDWLQPAFADSTWRDLPAGPWNLLDAALKDYHGAAAYRCAFTVPAAWAGRRVVLNLYSFNTPIVYDRGEVFVNGAKICDYQAHGWSQWYAYDITDRLVSGRNVVAVRVAGGQQWGGVSAAVWLAAEARLDPSLDLAGAWQSIGADYRVSGEVALPGRPNARAVVRDVALPDAWRGQDVVLHLESSAQWLGAIVVNGQPIATNGYLHPFAPRVEVAIAPYLHPGRNRIELWPYRTVPTTSPEGAPTVEIPIDAIRLGVRR